MTHCYLVHIKHHIPPYACIVERYTTGQQVCSAGLLNKVDTSKVGRCQSVSMSTHCSVSLTKLHMVCQNNLRLWRVLLLAGGLILAGAGLDGPQAPIHTQDLPRDVGIGGVQEKLQRRRRLIGLARAAQRDHLVGHLHQPQQPWITHAQLMAPARGASATIATPAAPDLTKISGEHTRQLQCEILFSNQAAAQVCLSFQSPNKTKQSADLKGLIVFPKGLCHGCLNEPGRDTVDADVVGGVGGCRAECQAGDGTLGCGNSIMVGRPCTAQTK